ncbi:hypothetical protein HN51_067468 [Arachis hypogaea]
MARTKNAKRARVKGESSAPARLIASFHYMARWLPSRRALNNYVEKFESRAISFRIDIIIWDDYYPHLIRDVYSTLNYVVPEPDEKREEVMPLIEFELGKQHYRVTLQELAEQWSLVYHGAKFTGGIAADEEWGEYNRLVGLQSLQYENPHMDARDGKRSGCPRTSGLRTTTRPGASTTTDTPPPPPSPTMQDLMDELRSMRVYIEEQFADMRQRQDRQTKAINRQGEAIDILYTNLGITNPRGIIPRPGP